jgi:hypothetical protein
VNQSVSAHSATALTIHAAANATGGPFTAVNVVTPPTSGTAIVKGLDIVYLPDPTITQAQTVTVVYTLGNAFGASSNITVTITVTPSTQQVSESRRPPEAPPGISSRRKSGVSVKTLGGAA